MKIGDVYYEKHTVVGISKRTNTISETDVEIVNVLPIEVLNEIRAEIPKLTCGDNEYRQALVKVSDVIKCIDKYRSESEE